MDASKHPDRGAVDQLALSIETEADAMRTECEHVHVWYGDDGSGRKVEPEPTTAPPCKVCGGRPRLIKVMYVRYWPYGRE
jgi:hypothetical protein